VSAVKVSKSTHAISCARSDSESAVLLYASLPARPEQCAVARHMLVSVLEGWPIEPDTADAVLWALAELFANGLDHHDIAAGERLRVSLTANVGPARQWLALSVTDGGHGSLRARPESAHDEDGRGLNLVRGFGAKITDEVLATGYEVTAWVAENSQLRSQVCRCDCVAWGHQHEGVCTWTLVPAGLPLNLGEGTGQAEVEPICDPCAEHVERATKKLATDCEKRDGALSVSGQVH